MTKKSPAKLEFPLNTAGEEEGLNDPGIETFRDSPYASVAREHGQNSADARAHPRAEVELRFDVIEIPAAEYPMREQQVAAVKACLAKAKAASDQKAVDFFGRALAVLEAPALKALRIADFNTKGLVGPAVPGKPFHSLVKGTGVSTDKDPSSGGSFGIGKGSAFAASELQTVFYSTVYRPAPNGTPAFLAQGKVRLMSHRGSDGADRRATGYWGIADGFQPVSDPADVPAWLRRNDVGASVFVIGLRDAEGWSHRIAASLIQNFFSAIHDGTLRFLVDDGSIVINRHTLPSLIDDPKIRHAVEQNNQREEFDFAVSLYRCITSAATERRELDINGLGKIEVLMLLEDGLPKRLMIVRNGMAITDSLEYFGDKFARFKMYRDFVAVVRPLDEEGSAFIKRLENPQHNTLSDQRLPDEKKRREAVKVMKTLVAKLREAIKAVALPPVADQVALDELSEFFADVDPADKPPQPSNEENPEKVTLRPVPTRKRVQVPVRRRRPGRGDGGGGDSGGGGGGGGGARGSGTGRGTGGEGNSETVEPLAARDFRNIIPADKGAATRRLMFTPDRTCTAVVEVLATGLDQPSSLTIRSADAGTVKDGALWLPVTADHRVAVVVDFAEPYSGPIEVSVGGVTGGAT